MSAATPVTFLDPLQPLMVAAALLFVVVVQRLRDSQ